VSEDRVLATYLIETPHSLEHAAAMIAGEQSSGTFVSVPGETNELKERFGAQVLSIEPLGTVDLPSLPGSKPPKSNAANPVYRRGRIVVSFPLHNFGPSLPVLLSTVAGNLYELQEVSFASRTSCCRQHSHEPIPVPASASRARASWPG
jgi:ribulose-bisphosphate carboxylase large chain